MNDLQFAMPNLSPTKKIKIPNCYLWSINNNILYYIHVNISHLAKENKVNSDKKGF